MGTCLCAGEHVGAGGDDWHGVFLGVRWDVWEGERDLDGRWDDVSGEFDVFEHHGMKIRLFELGISQM